MNILLKVRNLFIIFFRKGGIISFFQQIYWSIFIKYNPFIKRYFVGNYLGNKFLYDKKNDGCQLIMFNPYFENFFMHFMEDYLKKDMIFFDIGCNIGTFSLIAAKQGCNVFSFDINKDILQIVKTNRILNNYEDLINIYNYGFTNFSGETKAHIFPSQCSGVSSLIKKKEFNGYQSEEQKIDCITLDDFLLTHKLNEKISILKIDIEGNELNFFLGGKKTLEKGIIKLIFWETNSSSKEELINNNKILNLLKEYGYNNYEYVNNIEKLKPFHDNNNCISIHKDHINEFNFLFAKNE